MKKNDLGASLRFGRRLVQEPAEPANVERNNRKLDRGRAASISKCRAVSFATNFGSNLCTRKRCLPNTKKRDEDGKALWPPAQLNTPLELSRQVTSETRIEQGGRKTNNKKSATFVLLIRHDPNSLFCNGQVAHTDRPALPAGLAIA